MKIPTTVITGFLGAGKTTLIRNLLERANGKRIALIINEFGDLGVDGEILAGCDAKGCDKEYLVELANGCICCTVADDFVPTLEALIHLNIPPEHIIIETSGLALPKPLVKAFNWPEICTKVTVDSVITVVDTVSAMSSIMEKTSEALENSVSSIRDLDHESPIDEVFEDQLMCADIVILNKCDLVPADKIKEVKDSLINRVSEGVNIVTAQNGEVDIDVLIGLGASVEEFINDRKSHHDGEEDHDHNDFDTIVVQLGEISDPIKLDNNIRKIAEEHGIIRVKGFIDVAKKPMRQVVQAVGKRVQLYFDREWRMDEKRESRLVVIGLAGFNHGAVIDILKN